MNRIYIFFLLGCVVFFSCKPQKKTWELNSPDKKNKISLHWERNFEGDSSWIHYSVQKESDDSLTEIIKESPLGVLRKDAEFIFSLTPVNSEKEKEVKENFEMFSGKQSQVKTVCNELTVLFKNKENDQLVVDLRAYNDGVAFRYRFPENDSLEYTVQNEITGFHLPVPGKAWIAPYDTVTEYTPAYETYYENGMEIGKTSPRTQGWAFPALFEVNNTWLLITESNLGMNYFGAHLNAMAPDGLYTIRLPEKEESFGTGPAEPTSTLPWTMPWRLIMIGSGPGDILVNNLVPALSEPNKLDSTGWIRPGKASWSWWSDPPSPTDFNQQKEFVDLAADMGWEYTLVDANWNKMKKGNVQQLAEYAHSKNIGLWLWYNSGGPHNTVTEAPRDLMFHPDKRREEFAKLQEWGVKGIKVDFFQSDKPHVIGQYHDILKDASDYHIMVNFHGCTLPRGWARTWPHNLGMEAVRGEECYIFDQDFPSKAPWYNTILAFTRNVVGSMDYTPTAFSNQRYAHQTTYGHELALSVVFESGILHFADRAQVYRNLPDYVKVYLKEVPVAWDETRFLEGYPGEYCILARRKNSTWYFAGISGKTEPLTIRLKLPFLEKTNRLGEIISDGKDPHSFIYSKDLFNDQKEMEIHLLPFGGFAGRIVVQP